MDNRPHIVYLPGFLGTELKSVGSGQPLWQFETGVTRQLADTDPESLPPTQVIPGKPLRFVYRPHISSLRQRGYCVHWCGYDWRMGLMEHRERLRRFIDAALGETPYYLAGHSTGGLISLLHLRSGPGNCKGLICMGAPLKGSGYLWKFLHEGDERLQRISAVVNTVKVRRRLSRLPLVYELLPAAARERCWNPSDQAFEVDRALLDKAASIHDAIAESLQCVRESGLATRFIINDSHATPWGVWHGSHLDFANHPGDGWITAGQACPEWQSPARVSLTAIDYAAAGIFGLYGKILAPHPFQPMYPSVRTALLDALESIKEH